jgi:type II secretory pathway pseudopilin PulG
MRAFNLIPAEQRSGGASLGAGRSHGAAYAVLGVLGVLAVFALLYGVANHQVSSRQAQVSSLTAQVQQAQAQAAQLTPYTSFAALREQRTKAVSDLVDSRFDWAHAVHELGRVLPPGTSIASLTGTIGATATASASPAPAAPAAPGAAPAAPGAAPAAPGAAPAAPGAATAAAVTSATPPGSVPQFTLSGCATSQSEVALTLNRLRLIDGVSEVTLQSSTKGGGSGGSGASGCSSKDPVFTVQVAFAPLPAAAALSSLTRTASAKSSATAPSTTPSGGSR